MAKVNPDTTELDDGIETFFIGEREFHMSALRTDKSLEQWATLAAIFEPLLVDKKTELTDAALSKAMTSTKQGLKLLPELLNTFAEVTKFRDEDGSLKSVKALKQKIFQRQPLVLVEFLLNCLKLEYGGFLDVSGHARIGALVKGWVSHLLPKHSGPSSESSQADTSGEPT